MFHFVPGNEELHSDVRSLDINYIYENDIKYGPTMIDTLTFSFKNFRDQEVLSMLQPFGFDFGPLKDGDSFISKGGYERIYVCRRSHSTFKASWLRLGHSEISVLSLTGTACSLLYCEGRMYEFIHALYLGVKSFGLFGEYYTGDRSFKCTRFDLCKDNFTDYFEKIAKGDYGNLSQMFYSQGLTLNPDVTFCNGQIKGGWTLYFGRRDKSTFIRIYDKRSEQRVSDERLPYWSRLEFEIKNNNNNLQANNIFSDLISGKGLDDILIDKCKKSFYMLKKPWTESYPPRHDEVIPDREFMKFVSSKWDNVEQNLCFANSLFWHDLKKSDDTVQRLVSALVPKVFANKTMKQIVYSLQDLIYSDGRMYRIDKIKHCIYIYYRSSTNDIMNDVPCLALDIPSQYWDDVCDLALSGDVTCDELIKICEDCTSAFLSESFSFGGDPDVL